MAEEEKEAEVTDPSTAEDTVEKTDGEAVDTSTAETNEEAGEADVDALTEGEAPPAVEYDGTKSILVVEDTAAVRRIVVKFLERKDYKVIEAANGQLGLKALKDTNVKIDMILLDVMMPVMDGLEFLKRMRSNDKYKYIPVSMLTSKSERTIIVDSLRLGAQDFIIKPFNYDTIIEKVEKHIGASAPKGRKAGEGTSAQTVNFKGAKSTREKVDILITRVRSLLALPFSVIKISTLCGKEDTGARDLEKPILGDPAVASVVLARANSTAFRGNEKISDIVKAVTRLGMKETRNIAVTFSVIKLFSKDDHSQLFNKIEFWIHSLSVAICAQNLSALLKCDASEDVFLSGLLHDIGKMIFDDFLNEDYQKALKHVQVQRFPVRDGEMRVFETNHAFLGGMVAEKWGFPEQVVEAILNHHKNDRFTEPSNPVSITEWVVMGNQMAKILRFGNGGDSCLVKQAMGLWHCFDNKDIDWSAFLKKTCEDIAEFMELLKVEEDYVDLEIPEDMLGEIAYYNPEEEQADFYLPLAATLSKHGFTIKRFHSLNDLVKGEGGFKAIIADLIGLENAEVAKQKESLDKACSNIILLSNNEDLEGALTMPLDVDKLIGLF